MSSLNARRAALGLVLSCRQVPTRRPLSMVVHCSPVGLRPNSHYACFLSYLSKPHIHSQAESKIFCDYLNEIQTRTGPRFLTAKYYHEDIQTYLGDKDEIAASAELGNQHVPAAPILEVLFVKVQSNKYDHDYQVYGVVQLIDNLNNAYDVFHRKSDNPETVSPGGNLSLTDSYGRPTYLLLSLASSFKMRVHLRDAAADGKEIAKGDSDLLSMENENITTQVIHSPDGTSFASVQYLTLLHGVIAVVKYWLIKIYLSTVSRSHSVGNGDIYGNITATILSRGNITSRVLFNRSPSEPIKFNSERIAQLCETMFAVPACASLHVEADLWDHLTNQQIVNEVIFARRQAEEPCCVDQICVLGQDFHGRFIVNWKHAYQMQRDDEPQRLSAQHTSSALGNRRSLLSMNVCSKPSVMPHISGSKMAEVFSISITPNSDVNLRLCGTIEVGDIMNPENKSYCIFERKNNWFPEFLSGDLKIKFLEWPSCPFNGKYFGMRLHLYDDAGREVSKGFLHWDKTCIDYPISWYDKGISSVIRGEYGYATVHYAIFSNAVQATVKVIFIPNPSFDVLSVVNGNIVARYSSFLYSNCIEKKFFQSTLFGDDRYPILAAGGSLCLQKSVVPVPVDSSLVLDMKLEAKVMDEFSKDGSLEHYGSLDEVVDFEIDVGKTSSKRIEGKGFDVEVWVEWSILDEDESDIEVIDNSV